MSASGVRGNGFDAEAIADRPIQGEAPSVTLTSVNGHGHPKRLVIGAPGVPTIPPIVLGANANGARVARAMISLDDGLTERLRDELPDEVYFVLGGDVDENVLVDAAPSLLTDGVTVHVVVPEGYRPPVRTTITHFGDQACISLQPMAASATASSSLRRLFDVVGATLLLILLSPVLAILAALVLCTMGEPILFGQERVGQFGHIFTIYKFRSMVRDAERVLQASPELHRRYVESNFKLSEEEDPRITPLGRFLRKTSLDELPQLWNVLRGDMRLVGPRPVVPDEVAMYGDYGRMLLRMKPGLTGRWQVTGRSMVPYPERARLDLEYVATRSLRDDLRILLQTIPAVIRRRGAI